MSQVPLRAFSFLAPNMFGVYQTLMSYVARRLNLDIQLTAGETYADVSRADLCFICGLPYALRTSPCLVPSPLEAIAAPVLVGERFRGQPIYFSDVIVRRARSYQSFSDLRGCSW